MFFIIVHYQTTEEEEELRILWFKLGPNLIRGKILSPLNQLNLFLFNRKYNKIFIPIHFTLIIFSKEKGNAFGFLRFWIEFKQINVFNDFFQ